MRYTVLLVYPGHSIEIPCSTKSTAKVALKNFFTEADIIDEGLTRIKVINPEGVVILSMTAERK